MEDFLEYYYANTETIVCPLGLLLRFNNTDKSDVLSFIIEKEIYSKIFNIEELIDIKKSMVNPLIIEDNNKIIYNILIDVCKKYIEAVKLRMIDIDTVILERLATISFDSKYGNKEEDIINKLKSNSVIKEYLPQALENNGLNIENFVNDNKLNIISVDDITNMVKELSIFKIVMANIYYLMDNKSHLELRFEEKNTDIIEADRITFNKVNTINLEGKVYEDFIILYNTIVTLENKLNSSITEIKNIKKTDLYNINDLYLNVVIKLDKDEISDDDLYIFEKGQEVKVCEQNMYIKLLDGLVADIRNINEITDRISVVLNKIDL